MEDSSLASQLILQLLSNQSPELGARLKQRLNALLLAKGLARFDEKFYGYKRFSDFLENVLGDKVSIDRPNDVGDIHVALRQSHLIKTVSDRTVAPPVGEHTPVIRSDVWQAFANPDPRRKRFFHRRTREVRHYLEGDAGSAATEIERDAAQFVEIHWISGDTQAGWMKSFLDAVKLSQSQRTALEAMIAGGYSSGINAAFTGALGEHSSSWRHCRTNHVTSIIRAWAEQHSVPFGDLCVRKDLKESGQAQVHNLNGQLTPRQQAVKLLELLTDEDIARLVIPTLLSSILIKSRL